MDQEEINHLKEVDAVLIDPNDIEPKYLKQVGRGFGNEVYLSTDSEEIKNCRNVWYKVCQTIR